jgi:hypothetical protein
MKIRTHARTVIACTAAASIALLSSGASAGATISGGTAVDNLVGDLVGAAWARFPQFAAVPASLGIDAPVVLHGRLSDPAGAPLAGAQVLLAAWPSNTVLHALRTGDGFAITPVARTIAASDGRFELRSMLTPVLAALSDESGVNVELDVFHGDRHYTYQTSVVPDASSGGWVYRALRDTAAERPSVLANSRNALDITVEPQTGRRLSPELFRDPVRLPGGDPPPAPPGCGRYEDIGTKDTWTTVASAVVGNGASVTVEYSENAESEISTGASLDGGLSWSAGLTDTAKSGRGAKWHNTAKRGESLNQVYQAEWRHKVLERKCNQDMTGKHFDRAQRTTPDHGTGGFRPVKGDRKNPIWACNDSNSKPANATEVWTDDEQARTYSRAFSMAPTGTGTLTGSAQSGYSKAVKIIYGFTHTNRAYWCGDTNVPGADGQRLQGSEVAKGQHVPGSR